MVEGFAETEKGMLILLKGTLKEYSELKGTLIKRNTRNSKEHSYIIKRNTHIIKRNSKEYSYIIKRNTHHGTLILLKGTQRNTHILSKGTH